MGFGEIIGHRRPIRLLQKSILNDHLPHAYLFLGPQGIGKRITALTLAKALDCDDESGDSCDKCLSCRKISDSNHPDVFVISPDGQFIKIEQIRQLQRSLSYRPYEGKKRVCIMDGADEMTAEGANALLKTLEEPPPETLLILLATQKESLLPTIVSRCQQVSFSSLPIDQLTEELATQLSLEKRQARTLAELSQGSPGRALEMFHHDVWERRPSIIRDLIGLSSQSLQHVFDIAKSLADRGEDLPLVFPVMISWYRDLIIWNEGNNVDQLINQDFCEEVKEKAVQMSRRSLIRRIEAINETSKALSRNANRQLAMESLMLELR
ncbi:MAG: DNA polymerase III subunit delta' [Proteobacteria bacterium]|nr:DNA polymerase III subunit delta' [Pseudomonadota bacterium]